MRIGPLGDSTLVAQQLGRMRRVVVAGTAFLRRYGAPTHPDDLREAPCIHDNGVEGHLWPFRMNGKSYVVAVHGVMQSNLSAPMLDACAAGFGFARCLHYQAEPLLRARKLRIVLADFENEPWPVHVTYPSARLMSRRTHLFVEALKSALVPALQAPAVWRAVQDGENEVAERRGGRERLFSGRGSRAHCVGEILRTE